MPFLIGFMKKALDRQILEELYHRFNDRSWVKPDPLQFLYRYQDPADIEVVGLLVACLAYGRVAQILKSLEQILLVIGPPAAFAQGTSQNTMEDRFAGFCHRWTRGPDVAALLFGIGRIQLEYGSLQDLFVRHQRPRDANVLLALDGFAGELRSFGGSLLADPCKGSACKRLHLFLRWMVRKDNVDLGIWEKVSPARLLVPLDTHMHRIARALGATERAQADSRTALEITSAFAEIAPEDPIRYDFALTRFGIRNDLNLEDWLDRMEPVKRK